jgi:hypothetical protein
MFSWDFPDQLISASCIIILEEKALTLQRRDNITNIGHDSLLHLVLELSPSEDCGTHGMDVSEGK